MLIFHN